MQWQDRITVDPSVQVGKPVVKGTRITVEFVIERLACGWTSQQVVNEYKELSPEDVRACLAYASEVLKGEKVYVTPA
ncbi:MAG: DUF433 domain-containing protein [Phycisphaerae bacterium]